MDLKLCVTTKNYVSTRGGELRDEEYVVSAETRRFLEDMVSRKEFPSSLQDLADLHLMIHDQVEYSSGKVKGRVSIRDDVFELLREPPEKVRTTFDDLLKRFSRTGGYFTMDWASGFGTVITAEKDALLQFIKNDVQDQIVTPLISGKFLVSKEEIEVEESDFVKKVRMLVTRKFSLYSTAAQFGGKEIFESRPYIEKCIIDLTTPTQSEEGLSKFINNLHQVLEESSKKEVLKFREGDFTSLEEWLEIEIPSEATPYFENAKSFFSDLNRLRNFYNHSVEAKGIFETGLIFNRLIGKYSPEKDDILRTEVILLDRAIRALESLERTLTIILQMKG